MAKTETILSDYFRIRQAFFEWRYNATAVQKFLLAAGMACITGVAAQIRFPLPWTPVPITCQTFSVLLAGVILGGRWGGISQGIYAVAGAAGIPWFAGFGGGVSALAGPTGGYLLGFVLAAMFLGYVTEKYPRSRNFFPILGLMAAASLLLIHLPGMLYLQAWYSFAGGRLLTPGELLWMGSLPFLAGDAVKVIAAALTAKAVLPKEGGD